MDAGSSRSTAVMLYDHATTKSLHWIFIARFGPTTRIEVDGLAMNNAVSFGVKDHFSISDVEEITGLSQRTIRYYISEGLIPPAHGRGPSATYDKSQLLRLNFIQLLRAEHKPLEEIKRQLGQMSDRQVEAILSPEPREIGEHWRRIALHPDIELHVRSKPSPNGEELEETVSLIVDYVKPLIERMNRKNGRQPGR